MSIWFYPVIMSAGEQEGMIARQEFLVSAKGLPDLSKAHSREHIQEWLAQLMPDTTPEQMADKADHWWRLGQELSPDDHILVITNAGESLMMGEVTGAYTRESGEHHRWPVRWLSAPLSPKSMPELAFYLRRGIMVEITDEETLKQLRAYIPSLRKRGHTLFRWVAIATLISELIYFWPR